MRAQRVLKLVVGLAVLLVLPWLFLRTLRDTIAEPYDAAGFPLSGWTVALGDPARQGIALLGLQPPQMLPPALFGQLFDRTMTSMTSPGDAVLPVVLRSELRGETGLVLAPDEILDLARAAGLAAAPLDPVCMADKREPFAGRTREFYFVLFDSPEVSAFRRQLSALAAARGVAGAFTGDQFPLVLPIAGSDARFDTWWPLEVDRAVDCQAPVG